MLLLIHVIALINANALSMYQIMLLAAVEGVDNGDIRTGCKLVICFTTSVLLYCNAIGTCFFHHKTVM
jgi:hypothetical protein